MRRRSSALIWSSRRSTTDKTRSRRSSGVMLESARTTTSSSIFKRATSWCGNSLIITRVHGIRHVLHGVVGGSGRERPCTPRYSVLGTRYSVLSSACATMLGWVKLAGGGGATYGLTRRAIYWL